MTLLALDVGDARIGVATSDETETLATPFTVIKRHSNAEAFAQIERIVADAGVRMVVVGLPVSFDGNLHGQARLVQVFGEKLRQVLGIPVVYADETLSTVRAEEFLRETGVRPRNIREKIDAAAAAVILQDYLDQR